MARAELPALHPGPGPGRVAVVAAALLAVGGAGCLSVSPYACGPERGCARGAEPGTCEPTGWCSFVDAECASGRRYGAGAGDGLAGTCVDLGPAADAGVDQGGVDAALDDAAVPDDAAQPDGAPCTQDELACNGDDLLVCDLGAFTVKTTCGLGCKADETPARCYTFVPHNVPAPTLTAGTADWIVTADANLVVATATLPAGVGRQTVTQTGGARSLTVLTVRSLEVRPGVILRFTGTTGVAIVASDHVLVDGVIDVSAAGQSAGPGGWSGGVAGSPGSAPSGVGGAPAGLSGGIYDDSGASGGCFAMTGGRGGAGGTAAAPAAGTTYGSVALTPLMGGAGGGGGSDLASGGVGGGGGGALQLTAAGRIDITGVVIAAGGGGAGGRNGGTDYGAGGGGGAGGGVLLEAPVVAVTGAGVVAANGGGGGGGAYYLLGVGGTGGAGQPSRTPATGGQGGNTTDHTLGAGGAGGAGTTAAADGAAGSGSRPNGGGGGGAVGRVVVCTRSGSAPTGTFSPDPQPLTIVPQ